MSANCKPTLILTFLSYHEPRLTALTLGIFNRVAFLYFWRNLVMSETFPRADRLDGNGKTSIIEQYSTWAIKIQRVTTTCLLGFWQPIAGLEIIIYNIYM